jgi:hypothetical protein
VAAVLTEAGVPASRHVESLCIVDQSVIGIVT